MILNADMQLQYLETRGLGSKAQVGYDLTLKGIKSINGGAVMVDKTAVEDYTEITPYMSEVGKLLYKLDPGTYSLTFEQGCKLPTNTTAFIRHRSSVLRCGGIITSGVYDPGFEVDEMGAVLVATKQMVIEKGARVAQIILFENYTAEAYNGQWMKEKDVK
jgi:deoxycytidine triphosphate deaminase